MARRRWRRGKRTVVRLADAYAGFPANAPTGAGSSRPWHVIILTEPGGAPGRHLYTTMTQDVDFALHRARSPLADSYAHDHALSRLVLVETFACRHTAFARVSRIRAWPVAERRRLIEAQNPDWRNLAPDAAAADADAAKRACRAEEAPPKRTQPTMPKAPPTAA